MLRKMIEAREEEGFTLIELLVVIIIIGILAAIAIPVFLNQRQKGWRSAARSDARNGGLAVESFSEEYDQYAPDDYDLTNTADPDIDAATGNVLATGGMGDDALELSRSIWVSYNLNPETVADDEWFCVMIDHAELESPLDGDNDPVGDVDVVYVSRVPSTSESQLISPGAVDAQRLDSLGVTLANIGCTAGTWYN